MATKAGTDGPLLEFGETLKFETCQPLSRAICLGDEEEKSNLAMFLPKWTTLRTNLNRTLILKSELRRHFQANPREREASKKNQQFRKILGGPEVEIDDELFDYAFHRALYERYARGRHNMVLKAESFLTFGIPRPKLKSCVSPSDSSFSGVSILSGSEDFSLGTTKFFAGNNDSQTSERNGVSFRCDDLPVSNSPLTRL